MWLLCVWIEDVCVFFLGRVISPCVCVAGGRTGSYEEDRDTQWHSINIPHTHYCLYDTALSNNLTRTRALSSCVFKLMGSDQSSARTLTAHMMFIWELIDDQWSLSDGHSPSNDHMHMREVKNEAREMWEKARGGLKVHHGHLLSRVFRWSALCRWLCSRPCVKLQFWTHIHNLTVKRGWVGVSPLFGSTDSFIRIWMVEMQVLKAFLHFKYIPVFNNGVELCVSVLPLRKGWGIVRMKMMRRDGTSLKSMGTSGRSSSQNLHTKVVLNNI